MREIRIFELGDRYVPVRWAVDRPQTLTAVRGTLWVTVEGQLEDIWLQDNESLELTPKTNVWISAEVGGGRFAVSVMMRSVHFLDGSSGFRAADTPMATDKR
jgi:hypothetical protein